MIDTTAIKIDPLKENIKTMYINKKNIKKYTKIKKKEPSIIKRIFTLPLIIAVIFSSLLYMYTSHIAYMQRGYKAIGGEIFFIILPILIIAHRIDRVMENKTKK